MSNNTSNGSRPASPADPVDAPSAAAPVAGQDLLPGAVSRSWGVPAQVAIMGLLLGIAVTALFAMRHFGTRGDLSSKTIKIDYPLEVSKEKNREQEKLIVDLRKSTEHQAGAIDRLHKNPFVLQDESVASTPVDDSAERALHEREERVRAIKAEIEGVQLHAIMGGSKPLARVNGQILKVGDRIGEYLTVAAIHGRSIEVTADGQTYAIDMIESNSNKPGSASGGEGLSNPRKK